jgi:phenylalanyl-tRNA synthetase beta chain
MRVPVEWLREFVHVRQKPEVLAKQLTMSGLEVESLERSGRDVILDINVTPNRGDCLSIRGIARELAAVSGRTLAAPSAKALKGNGRISRLVSVAVRDKARCPRYTARVIEGVTIGASPSWLVARLAACGIRSINNVVDATNYVMLEMGQPLHAFDLARIRGRRIIVARAAPATPFTAIDCVGRTLSEEDLLICDGGGPVALAGIMGGQNSEVAATTTNVLLESAFFAPAGVRRTSKRLGLSSESSRRFERGVDPQGVLEALQRAVALIVEVAGGTPTADWIDVASKKFGPLSLTLSEEEVNRILGTKLTALQIAKVLAKLGIGVARPNGGKIAATIPSFRPDLARPIDLIEEVARIYGYDELPEKMPEVHMAPLARPRFALEEELARCALLGAGLHEAVVMAFADAAKISDFSELGPTPVKIQNPLSAEQGVMCTTLLPGLLDALRINVSRQQSDVRLFALQRVYHRPVAVGPSDEPRSLAFAMTGRRFPSSWERAREVLDFYDAKGAAESVFDAFKLSDEIVYHRGEPHAFLHPGRFAYVLCGGQRVGFVGQLHPQTAARWELPGEVFVGELHFELLAERMQAKALKWNEPSRYPYVARDIAIVIDERVPLVEVEKVISDCDISILDDAAVFDVWQGKGIEAGRKSLAMTLRFSRSDRTLTDEEVTAAHGRIVGALAAKLGAELRS